MRQLVENEDEARLREVFMALMQDGHGPGAKDGAEPAKRGADRFFLGLSRRQLLRACVSVGCEPCVFEGYEPSSLRHIVCSCVLACLRVCVCLLSACVLLCAVSASMHIVMICLRICVCAQATYSRHNFLTDQRMSGYQR